MIDRDQLIGELCAKNPGLTVAEAAVALEKVIAEGRAEGMAEGAAAERARILGIQKIENLPKSVRDAAILDGSSVGEAAVAAVMGPARRAYQHG